MSLQATKAKRLNEEADQMIQALSQTAEAEPVQEVVEVVPDEVATSVQDTDTGATPVESAGTQPTDTTAEEVTRLRAEIDTANQRWRSLQGMMEKANADNEALRSLVQQLTQQLQAMNQTERSTTQTTSLVSDKDVTEYGEDMLDMVRRVAKEVATSEVAQLDGKFADVDKRVNSVGKVVAQTAAERFDTALATKIPEWQQINLDPEFAQWLGSYGLQALNAAYSDMNVEATAKFFSDYKVITGKFAPAVLVQADPPSAKLASLAAPGKAKSVPNAASSTQAKIWTAADVNKLYEDQRRNRITPEQFGALEADLFKAQTEGRFAH